MPAEGRGLGSRLVLEVAKHGRLGQPYRTPLMGESRERPRTPQRRERAIEPSGVRRGTTARAVGRLAACDLPCAKA
jgi:hypothetical protein